MITRPAKDNKIKRTAVFAHFDKNNMVDDYVVYYLGELNKVCTNIIFVSTSDLPETETSKIDSLCGQIILRENTGYDFGSWRTGIESISNINDHDEIVICNDSVYGPFYPLRPFFDDMSRKENDFWGMTENHEIAYHLQSYFMVFKKPVISSIAFRNFWDSVKAEPTKDTVIRKYEVGLTQTLLSAEFKPEAHIPFTIPTTSFIKLVKFKIRSALKKRPAEIIDKLISRKGNIFNQKKINLTHLFWEDLIIKYRMPFLKIELLRDNPMHMKIENYRDVITGHSSYNIDLIINHLKHLRN